MGNELLAKIKANQKWKRWAHRILIPKGDFRPRWWVSFLVNPWFHHKGRQARIRRSVRRDLFPFNHFSIGEHSLVEDFSVLNNGVGTVTIGEYTVVGISNVIIGPVVIGNGVMLAQHVVISGLNHGYEDVHISPSKQQVSTNCIYIDDDVWIGANATVTAGVRIGRHSVIGAGSVVTRDIPAYSVAVGNPARVIKQFDQNTKAWKRV